MSKIKDRMSLLGAEMCEKWALRPPPPPVPNYYCVDPTSYEVDAMGFKSYEVDAKGAFEDSCNSTCPKSKTCVPGRVKWPDGKKLFPGKPDVGYFCTNEEKLLNQFPEEAKCTSLECCRSATPWNETYQNGKCTYYDENNKIEYPCYALTQKQWDTLGLGKCPGRR